MLPFTPSFNGMQSHGGNSCVPQQVLFPAQGPVNSGNFGSSFNHLFPCSSGAQPQIPSHFHAPGNQSPLVPFGVDNTSMNFGNSHANAVSIPTRPPFPSASFPGVVSNHQHLSHAIQQTVHQLGFVPHGHLSTVQQSFNPIASFQPACWQFCSHQPSQGVNQNPHGRVFLQTPMGCLSQMHQMIDATPAVNFNVANQIVDMSGPEQCGNSTVNMNNRNIATDIMHKTVPNPNTFLSPLVDQKAMQVPPGPSQPSQGNTSLHSQGNTRKNFRNGPQGSRERYSPQKFQKHQSQHSGNPKGKFSNNHRNGWKGQQSGAGKPNLMNCRKNPMHEHKRITTSLSYTDEEIKKWREERKRNFPTRLNNKSNQHPDHEDTKMRRQQLKQILAKQAELGVEVAELPTDYLSESENQVDRNLAERGLRQKKGRFRNKFDRRGRHGGDEVHTKRQKLGQDATHGLWPSTRKPTLLEKLLSADIKRDKSHLLQVFRFMVLNSFFKDLPDKPVGSPLARVRDGSGTEDIVNEKYTLNEGDDAVSKVENNDDRDCDQEDAEDHGEQDENGCEGEEMVYGGQKDFREVQIDSSEGEEGEITD
ncbi:uncharacterized protein [Aristolochia californica]|uniref:uncharacterized protein isoform X2 n=1 Tax=Aristolochia californica TaxID=171875 RepID=UPI0035E18369